MKVLLLVQKEQRVILDNLYSGIGDWVDLDLRYLTDDQQRDLKKYFKEYVSTDLYDRIILFVRFKKEIRQTAFVQTIPNLVILEHDAYQNYMNGWKYKGRFSKYYAALPNARVIVSGYQVCQKLRAEGVDAVFVPKGYDQSLLKDAHKTRDIELGFVGSLKNRLYTERKAILENMVDLEGLNIMRTRSGEEYCGALNRIKYFLSADIGFGEYMIKNFEAMACGCLLFTFNQGESENAALGFRDMENVVLYSGMPELREKLAICRRDEALATEIAEKGKEHVENHFTFSDLGWQIALVLQPDLRKSDKKMSAFGLPALWRAWRQR